MMSTRRPPRPRDTNQLATCVVDLATGNAEEPEPKGKQLSGMARAASPTPEQRQEIGRKAAAIRWGRAVP